MKKEINPANISEDVWFYTDKFGFDFVVWIETESGERKAAQFRLLKSKIKKYL